MYMIKFNKPLTTSELISIPHGAMANMTELHAPGYQMMNASYKN